MHTGRYDSARRAWIVLGLVLLLVADARAAAAAKTVRLVIDYGDGVQVHFTALPWREGMTVLDALDAAARHPHGVKSTRRGSGSFAMVTGLGDVANEGGGSDTKNWLFRVNDKPATVGAGAYELKAGDTALWRFEKYDYNSK